MSGSIDDTSGDIYELDELLGAYALDAVDDHDRGRVEDYLRINPRAAAEVQEHREVATMLAFTGMDAPEGVWARIADQIDADMPVPGPELARVFAMAAPTPETTASSASAGEFSGIATPIRRTRSAWILGAAAAVALVVVGLASIVVGRQDDGDPIDIAYSVAASADGSATADLVAEGSTARATGVIDSDGRGFVDGAGLPRLGSDLTYQLWGVLSDSGDVVSIGILGRDPGLETFTVDGAVAALAITIEQAPGVVSDGNPDGAYVGDLG